MDKNTEEILHQNYMELYKTLQKDYQFKKIFQRDLSCQKQEGEAVVTAYPIQGVLKYHGMSDSQQRIAYFSSISLNNGAAATITYVNLSKNRPSDILILNGNKIGSESRIFQRVKFQLDQIRNIAHFSSKALIISRNVYLSPGSSLHLQEVKGKGLGTSASAGAAIAAAVMQIIYSDKHDLKNDYQVLSIFARFLAGSAARCATGGFSLWLSYPGATSWESFSVRLDEEKDDNFIQNLSLLTIPLESSLKTEHAHKSVLNSPFFEPWLLSRQKKIKKFIEALQTHNLDKIGEIMEEDTLALHSVSMTTGIRDYILAWEPETLVIMKKIREIRNNLKIPVYYSIDTGPTVVLITQRSNEKILSRELKARLPNIKIIRSKIKGAPHIVEPESPEYQVIQKDISKFIKNQNLNQKIIEV